jgi:hypothetical protein
VRPIKSIKFKLQAKDGKRSAPQQRRFRQKDQALLSALGTGMELTGAKLGIYPHNALFETSKCAFQELVALRRGHYDRN